LELNEQGVQAVKAKNFTKAEELFKRSIAVDPQNLTAVFNLASMYLTNKSEESAISLLETYTEKVQNDAGLFARLGDAYFATKKPDEALTAYEKALALDKGYPGLLERLGTVYALRNRFGDAERMLILASDQNPRDPQLLANLSSIYLKNKKPQESITAARRALQVKPTTEVYVTMGSAYETLGDFSNALISFQRAKDLGDKRAELEKKIAALTANQPKRSSASTSAS
jgi:tetratricopeptide (TPR) repeat protein